MSLLKKTLVLSGQPPKGYLTALQIGTTAGLKLTLSSVRPDMLLAARVDGGTVQTFPINALKEEFRLSAELFEKSQISAVIFLNAEVFAHTGTAPSIRFDEVAATAVRHDAPAPTKTADAQFDAQSANKSSAPYHPSDTKNTQQTTAAEPTQGKPEAKVNGKSAANSATEQAEPANYAEAEVVDDDRAFRFFKKQTDSHFYDRVRGRMDEMLTVHPREESLERVIPDSKWVKVPYSEDEFYVVGTLSDSTRVTHVGYGVKGIRSVLPPKEAENLSEFLPIDGDGGYWLMFQDADTGEMLLTE